MMMGVPEEEKQRILIVDDQPANIAVLTEGLKKDYTILVATTGEQAIIRAINNTPPPDLILLDIEMPGTDGFETLERLQAEESARDIPVIFLTARDGADDEIAGLSQGAVDYITKPYQLPIVRARIENHLKIRRQGRLLEEHAMLDPLTEIANRRRYDQALDAEWRRAIRNGTWLSLALVDIDFFKKFNDNYGHAAGDDCLRRVAHALARAFRRPGDLLARYGGEEFAAIMPNSDLAAAQAVLESARQEVEKLDIPHAHSGVAPMVTISVGVGAVSPQQGAGVEAFFKEVDQALYLAKEEGRNQVQSVSP